MLLFGIFLEAVQRFHGPSAHYIDSGLFAKGSLSYVKEGSKISFDVGLMWNKKNLQAYAAHFANERIAKPCTFFYSSHKRDERLVPNISLDK